MTLIGRVDRRLRLEVGAQPGPVELATWPRAEDSPEAAPPGWALAMDMLDG